MQKEQEVNDNFVKLVLWSPSKYSILNKQKVLGDALILVVS